MSSRALSSDTGIRPSSSQDAVLALGRPGFGLGDRLQFAGDGLQQVVRRHQALHHAVLVDHEHDAARPRRGTARAVPCRVSVSGTNSAGVRVLLHRARRVRPQRPAACATLTTPTTSSSEPRHTGYQECAPSCADLAQAPARWSGRRPAIRRPSAAPSSKSAAGRPGGTRSHHLVLVLLDHAGVHALLQAVRDFLFGHAARRVRCRSAAA